MTASTSMGTITKVAVGLFILAGIGILEIAITTNFSFKTNFVIGGTTNNASKWPSWIPRITLNPTTATSDEPLPSPVHNVSSKWFTERFNGTIDIFWTLENMKLPKDIHTWWSKLQPRAKPPDIYKVLGDLYKEGLQNNTATIPRYKPRRCAVIGSSGNLLESHYGEEIDGHDLVVRFNNAKTKGFERDVGTLTTHHLAYPLSAIPLQKATSLIFVPFKPADLQWLLNDIKSNKTPKKFNSSIIHIMHPTFMRYVHKVWLNERAVQPSAGMLGTIICLQVCDTVDAYGFGADKNGGWSHYYEKLSRDRATLFKKWGTHNADNERDVLLKLQAEGIIKIHKGTGK